MKASVRGVVLTLQVAGLLCAGGIAVFQNHLIYFPENPPLADVLADARHRELMPWPDENNYRGLLREPAGPVRGTVLLLHGNAGRAGQRDGYANGLTQLGLRVILAEYPAYGSRPGQLGETALVAKPKRMWIVPAADHNDWMGRVDPAWWESVIGFLIAQRD